VLTIRNQRSRWQSKVILFISELWLYLTLSHAQAVPMPSKDKDVFYLKLQWISTRDEAERKKLAEKIRQALSESQKK
jgi:hypothetical protein